MKLLIPCLIFALVTISCKLTEQKMPGTYRLKNVSRTRLVLNSDKTFEFVKNFSEPGPVFFPDSTELNFYTRGNWTLNQSGQLVLNSDTRQSPGIEKHFTDSVTKYTDITSFSFWDQYGDAVPIRLIRFPANRMKLYKGNTISFFADDFLKTDTIEFHFYRYAPYRWIVTPAEAGHNNQHRVTFHEPLRLGYFKNQVLTAHRNKISQTDGSFFLVKTD